MVRVQPQHGTESDYEYDNVAAINTTPWWLRWAQVVAGGRLVCASIRRIKKCRSERHDRDAKRTTLPYT